MPTRGRRTLPGCTKQAWEQPFRWGLLLAFDAEAPGYLPKLGGTTVSATGTCIAVPVRQATDVDHDVLDRLGPGRSPPDFRVRVRCLAGAGTGSVGGVFDGHLRCPSGRLVVGDAEMERVIEMPAGRLRVQVECAPSEHAERVTLWICGTM